jgi:hypothetical protein
MLETWSLDFDISSLLPGLTYFSLTFRKLSGEFVTRGVSPLASSLQDGKALESLSLSFNRMTCPYSQHTPQMVNLRDFILPTTHWQNLTSLSVEGICTTQKDLEAALLRHTDTLRSLEFANIVLLHPISNDERHGSWIDVIHFLADSMSLTHIELISRHTNLTSTWGETCISCDRSFHTLIHVAKPPPDISLLDRIKRLIIYGKKSPFTKLRDAELSSESDHQTRRRSVVAWDYAGDYSWWLEGCWG